MQGLLNSLVGDLVVEFEQGRDTCGGGGTEVGDVIYFMLMQTDPFDQVDLDFIGGSKRSNQIVSVSTALLGNG